MTRAGERKIVKEDHVRGGAGFMLTESLLAPEELGEHCKLFARVTLKPGCEVGHHDHHGETETYYILAGKGEYDDNGKAVPVEVGDVTFCKDGDSHGLKNTGTEDLEFIALILKK